MFFLIYNLVKWLNGIDLSMVFLILAVKFIQIDFQFQLHILLLKTTPEFLLILFN